MEERSDRLWRIKAGSRREISYDVGSARWATFTVFSLPGPPLIDVSVRVQRRLARSLVGGCHLYNITYTFYRAAPQVLPPSLAVYTPYTYASADPTILIRSHTSILLCTRLVVALIQDLPHLRQTHPLSR